MFRQPYLNEETDLNFGGDDGFEETEVVTNEESEVETEEAVEKEEPTVKAEDTKPAETVIESPKVKLKYNHEEKEYSLDDVVPLAQKGLNYDKLQEKFNEIQSNPALSKYSKVQEVSELLGYQSDDELLEALYNTYYERAAETQGLTPQQIKKDHELTQKERAVKAKETTIEQEQKSNEMYLQFTKNYPDVKPETISAETWKKVDAGMDLTAAYTLQVNKELQEQLKMYKQNEQNTKKAPIGSVTKNGGGAEALDPFLEGFEED